MDIKEYSAKYFRIKNLKGGYREMTMEELEFMDSIVQFVGQNGEPLDNCMPRRNNEQPEKLKLPVQTWLERQEEAFMEAWKQESRDFLEEAVWGSHAPGTMWLNIIEDPNTM